MRHKIQWFLFNITANINFIVTIIYWSVLYRSSRGLTFEDFNFHATPCILTTLDLCVTALPVRLLHVVYPAGFGIAYVTMTLIFWAAGGTPNRPIYPFLDYENKPGVAAGLICGIGALIVVLHGGLWIVYKLRIKAGERYRRECDVTPEDTNISEETI